MFSEVVVYFDISPGALAKILAKSGNKCYKAGFLE